MQIPATHLGWPVHGAGMDNIGRNGEPEEIATPRPGPREILARVDAVGLCFSDVKLIRAGNDHPRIETDLAEKPIVPGHEAVLTIAAVGAQLADRYAPGQRYIIQADMFKNGKSHAFGYVFDGAMQQWVLLPEIVFDGDDAPYLLPVRETTGFSEAALVEPWACVDAAYHIPVRNSLNRGGNLLVVGAENAPAADFTRLFARAAPAVVTILNLDDKNLAALENASQSVGAKIDLIRAMPPADSCDDIVVLGVPGAPGFRQLANALRKNGSLCILAAKAFELAAEIDLGRAHYQRIQHIGAIGNDPLAAFDMNARCQIRSGGVTWVVGGAGPMGQMHIQLMLELDRPPQTIVASDVSDERIAHFKKALGPLAESRGVKIETYNPTTDDEDEFLRRCAPDGFDDVVIMAPVAKLVERAAQFAGRDCVVNVFAGVPVGTMATLPIGAIAAQGVRYLGSSGSSMDDINRVLANMQNGKLDTDRSCAAVGGMFALKRGLIGVRDGTYPGKIVIYPQLSGLELCSIPELAKKFPSVGSKLTDGTGWNRAAEKELLRLAGPTT